MPKKFVISLLFVVFISSLSNAAVHIRYHNQDSKTYTWDVKIAGVKTTVEFGSSRTSSVTIQGGATECIIYTPCGEIKLSTDVKITIKNGCISIG